MKMSNMKNLCLILLGNTVYALAIVMFILPNDIITGGTTGLGIAVNHYFGLQIHTFVLIFNTLMFLLGAAVLGMNADQIDAVIEPIANVTVANYNCPGQIVITGRTAGIEQASKVLKEAGAKRVVPLNVSGPFHSPMLRSAGEKLGKELSAVQLGELKIPYVTNVTAEYVTDSSRIRELLTRQVYSPVRWEQSIRKMIAQGVDTFVEIGPGRTLTGFLRKIDRNVTVYQVNTWEDAKQIMEELWKKK